MSKQCLETQEIPFNFKKEMKVFHLFWKGELGFASIELKTWQVFLKDEFHHPLKTSGMTLPDGRKFVLRNRHMIRLEDWSSKFKSLISNHFFSVKENPKSPYTSLRWVKKNSSIIFFVAKLKDQFFHKCTLIQIKSYHSNTIWYSFILLKTVMIKGVKKKSFVYISCILW